jgi:uncharacterized protein involved in type VI secretion and phage assembly
MSVPGLGGGGRDGGLRGVAIGVVSANDDPEGLARVKLTFPWRDADDESYWARIATPMAGADRGTYFLPEVGDEVLVAFEGGDIHYPYVLGALWNGEDTPPETNADGNNDVRTVRSRSGHELRFDDNDTAGRVELKTAGGRKVVLDDESGNERISVQDGQGNRVVVDSTTGEVTVEAAATVRVAAPMIELASDGNVTIDAKGVLTLNGSLVKIN